MAFVNRFQHLGSKRVGDLHERFTQNIIQLEPANYKCINVVGDLYDIDRIYSLKSHEIQRRMQSELSFLLQAICDNSNYLPGDTTFIMGESAKCGKVVNLEHDSEQDEHY